MQVIRWPEVAILLIAGVCIVLAGSPALAVSVDQSVIDCGKEVLADSGGILLSPFEWEKDDWLKAAVVVGTTALLIHNDQQIQDYFQDRRTASGDDFANFAENFGDPKVVFPALVLFYGYGRMSGDSKVQEVALLSLESATIAAGYTSGLKMVTHRSRPKAGTGPDEWAGISGSFADQTLSFPSAHSAIAFSTATVFATKYRDIVWVPYLSYTLATCVALSRVNDNEHWSSDVFFGSFLGWYTARCLLNGDKPEAKDGITVSPFGTRNGFGLSLSCRF